MKNENEVDKNTILQLMDKWTVANIDFKDAIEKVKEICVTSDLPGPHATGQFEWKIKPEKCYGTDELMERKCCIFPPFFKREVARACGAIFAVVFVDMEYNVTSLRRKSINTCDYWRCILNKYGILDGEDMVNNERYYSHLDTWVNLNPEFSHVMTNGKVFCREQHRFQMPLNVCEFFDFQNCIRNYVLVDCPKIINTEKCREWKDFYEECREFYL